MRRYRGSRRMYEQTDMKMRTHKKSKTSVHELRFDVFRASLQVVITEDVKGADKKYNFFHEEMSDIEVASFDGYTNPEFIGGWALMVLKPHIGINEISHEASHFVNGLFIEIGQKADADNDEVFSYILGVCVRKGRGVC